MDQSTIAKTEALKKEWTDQFVQVKPDRPELKRFAGIVGRVVTVNWNNKAVIDFQDGGWSDIAASSDHLEKLPPRQAQSVRQFGCSAARKASRPLNHRTTEPSNSRTLLSSEPPNALVLRTAEQGCVPCS